MSTSLRLAARRLHRRRARNGGSCADTRAIAQREPYGAGYLIVREATPAVVPHGVAAGVQLRSFGRRRARSRSPSAGTCAGGGRGDHSGRNARECGGMSRALRRRRPRRAGSRPCHPRERKHATLPLRRGARVGGTDRDHFLEGLSGSARDADVSPRRSPDPLHRARPRCGVKAAVTPLRWVGGLGDAPASALWNPEPRWVGATVRCVVLAS